MKKRRESTTETDTLSKNPQSIKPSGHDQRACAASHESAESGHDVGKYKDSGAGCSGRISPNMHLAGEKLTPKLTQNLSPLVPATPRPELSLDEGRVRRCFCCKGLTIAHYQNHAYRCRFCGYATAPVALEQRLQLVARFLDRLTRAELEEVCTAAMARLWEIEAGERGESFVLPKSRQGLVRYGRAIVARVWEIEAVYGSESVLHLPAMVLADELVKAAPTGRRIESSMRDLRVDKRPVNQRFWSHVDKSGDCWIWTAGTASGKPFYQAREHEGGKKASARRWAWFLQRGAWPDGWLWNVCGEGMCVRPEHHELKRSE